MDLMNGFSCKCTPGYYGSRCAENCQYIICLILQAFKTLEQWGKVSRETVVLRRWGVLQDNLVLSTELIM